MNRFSVGNYLQGLIVIFSAAVAFSVLVPASSLAADMDAQAKTLAKLDDDWSKAAATKDAGRVASFYAEDAIAYPPNEPVAIGRPAARKVWAAYFEDKIFPISWKTVQ